MSHSIKRSSLLFLIILIVSCKPETALESVMNTDLASIESRTKFLHQIHDYDQAIREESARLIGQPEELHEFWKGASQVDSMNLIKIDYYISQYGYPDTINYSKKAVEAPWYVIQHCPKIDERIKYYDLIKKAFEDGKINDIKFYLYLQRNYQFTHGEMLGIEYDETLSFQDKIQMLLDTLGYEKNLDQTSTNMKITTLQFSTEIKAEKAKIWNALWEDSSYRAWGNVFYEGSYALPKDQWKVGSHVHFLAPDHSGIYSLVEKHTPNEMIQFKHIGNVKEGKEQPVDDAAKEWSGATEIYKITEGSAHNILTIEIDILEEHLDFMKEKLPLALKKVKELSEN